MMLAVCQRRQVIEIDDMRHATAMLECLDNGVREVFEELGLTRVGEARKAVLDIVSRAPHGVTRVELTKSLAKRYDQREVEQQLDSLVQSAEVKRAAVEGRIGQVRYWINK